jgi:iron-sulfur cluster repair protein YtfE (RIC family)
MSGGAETIDTSDMLAVHQVFRTGFGDAARLLDLGADRHDAVVTYYANLLAMLEAHHGSEDVLVFPRLIERAPDHATRISEIAAEHTKVHEALTATGGDLQKWAAAADLDTTAQLSAGLADLAALLTQHLDTEEAEVLPLCADNLTAEEWGQIPGHGMASFTGDKPWLVLGLIRDNMTPAQREHMDAALPPMASEMWANFGEEAYRNLMAQLAA